MDPQRLATVHVSLAKKLARQIIRRSPRVDADDIQGAAYLGLVEAARTYRSEVGAFEPYAANRIRGAVLDWMRDNDLLSRDMRKHNRRIMETRDALTADLGRKPEEAEMARALGLTLEGYQRRLIRSVQPRRQVQIRSILPGHDGEVEHDVVGRVADPHPADEVKWLARRDAHRALAALPRRLREVARAYYLHERLLVDIGADHGITESRACQLLILARAAMAARWRPEAEAKAPPRSERERLGLPPGKPRRQLTREHARRAREMVAGGMTRRAVAEDLGTSASWVGRVLRDELYKVKPAPKSRKRKART